MDWFKLLEKAEGFDWDSGNATKSSKQHQVSCEEAEQVFFNKPLLLLEDFFHSKEEQRAKVFGITNEKRFITVSFTMRGLLIRVISARTMNKKERKEYEKQGE